MSDPSRILSSTQNEMSKALDALKHQFNRLQMGKATPGLVEDVVVEHYGSQMKLRELATITIPEPQQILITPWDKGAVTAIEKALLQSNLGLNPTNENQAVRVKIPPLTEERRKELKKVTSEYAEKTRVSLRNHRHDAIKTVKKQESDKELSEDESRDWQKKIDDATKDMNVKVDQLHQQKDQEIMTV